MNLAGLGVVIHEAVATALDRPWVLLVGVAMMLGGAGLRTLVRAATNSIESKSDGPRDGRGS